MMKRKINANAFALEALAAFGRYRTSIPVDMPLQARMELLQEWTKTAGSVVNEQIEELEAYELDDVVYANSVVDFTVNMSTLSFLEIMFVLNNDSLIRMLSEACPVDILLAAAALRSELQEQGEIPGDPENLDDWDKETGGKDGS
jgi:hypothetical protein